MTQNKMTLKERLIAQKQERLNMELLNRQEEKRLVPTSIPFNEGARKAPAADGIFYRSQQAASMTDAFKRLNNPELEKMKTAHLKATNLGPGVAQTTLDTFKLLRKDPIRQKQYEEQGKMVQTEMAKRVDDLVKQRDEFNIQIKEFNEQKERDVRAKREMQEA